MKLKCRPDDFCVEELNSFDRPGGPFAVYHLAKRSIGTPEAIDTICERWKILRSRVSFGGMKDRHAFTQQTLTSLNGPQRGLKQTGLDLTYQGQAPRAFAPADIDANRFTIIMRDMSEAAAQRANLALKEAQIHGIPNYFDDQRFGSVGDSGQFIAHPWCLGNFQRALWLVIAEPNNHDKPEDKIRKKLLRDHWGNWPLIASKIESSHIDRLVTFLASEKPASHTPPSTQGQGGAGGGSDQRKQMSDEDAEDSTDENDENSVDSSDDNAGVSADNDPADPTLPQPLPKREGSRSGYVPHSADHKYRQAFSMIPVHLRDLYLAAFQSGIWNRMLSLFIRTRLEASQVHDMKFDHDTLAFHRSLPESVAQEFRDMLLPLPSARAKIEDESIRQLCDRVLQQIGMELKQLKTKVPRDVYFSRGDRKAFVFPQGVTAKDEDDDMHPGRRMMTLKFDLPRGCYATILIKRITTLADDAVQS